MPLILRIAESAGHSGEDEPSAFNIGERAVCLVVDFAALDAVLGVMALNPCTELAGVVHAVGKALVANIAGELKRSDALKCHVFERHSGAHKAAPAVADGAVCIGDMRPLRVGLKPKWHVVSLGNRSICNDCQTLSFRSFVAVLFCLNDSFRIVVGVVDDEPSAEE